MAPDRALNSAPPAAPWLESLGALLPPGQVDLARRVEKDGGDTAQWLVQNRVIEADDLVGYISEWYERPAMQLAWYAPETKAVALVPEELARRLTVLPLFRQEDLLYVALVDPHDLVTQDFLQQVTGCSIEPVVALRYDLEAALNRVYLTAEQASVTIGEIAGLAFESTLPPELTDNFEDKDAPAIRLVDHILAQAVRLEASDVHLEPYARRVALRYRVDGILHDFPPPPFGLYAAVVSRIKIAARLDIAEKRLPQDGRMTFRVDERGCDMRVAVIPGLHGEGVVVRLLNTSALDRDLTNLGLGADLLERYERTVRRPHGMVLVTGPTGSGKTTTLYATLRHLYTSERKFVTLEDPVELQMEGINQIPVRPDIGFGFAEGLRAVLRFDPDVILVGEIRDLASAEIALRAALTGHVLLSTLHTNSAPLAVSRLVDMGLQGYMVVSALNGVLAQRLLRRLCALCRRLERPTAEQLQVLGLVDLPADATPFAAEGCPECGGLGYRGRLAIYEFLEITPHMRRLPMHELTAAHIRALADRDGFVALRETAIQQYLQGHTSLREVLALAMDE